VEREQHRDWHRQQQLHERGQARWVIYVPSAVHRGEDVLSGLDPASANQLNALARLRLYGKRDVDHHVPHELDRA
jgi:hypothetical protein